MAAVIGALGRLAAETDPNLWLGVGLSAMLPTLVRLDGAGEAIGNAIVWEDSRAEAAAGELVQSESRATAYRNTGQLLDGRYLVPMARRLRSVGQTPDSPVDQIVGAKDYIFGRLTGEILTDPSTAAGSGVYNLHTGHYASGDWERLPEVAAATTIRPLAPGVARLLGVPAGLPVALGAADSVLGAEALGARVGRDIAIISGTSTVVLGLRERLTFDPRERALVTPLALGGYAFEMDLVATGSAFQWLARLTGAGSPEELLAEAAEVDPRSAPSVLPFLGPGEQGALWDPALRGGFTGLTLGTTRAQLMRGLTTGILLELRRCVSVLAETPDARILVAGSSLAAEFLLQDLSDATGLPVLADRSEADHSALGAVDVLLEGIGVAAARESRKFDAFTPNPEAANLWADLARRHEHAIVQERERVSNHGESDAA